jgi:prophage tail gpP-like protein
MEMTTWQRMKIERLIPNLDAAFEFMLGDAQNVIEELVVGGDVVYRLAPLGIITDRVPE